jgi:thiamine biosynthesis lipoprotein
VALDLGAVAKAEALDRAAEVLREHGVEAALLHGGTSSVLAIGAPPGERGWRVGIADLACALLRDAALGVSGNRRPHVRDPRTGATLADAPRTAAVVAPTAAAADALSTALLVASGADFSFVCRLPT